MSRVLLFFVDGVGIGDDDAATNPAAAFDWPVVSRLLGGARPVAGAASGAGASASVVGLDATLGVPGLPQSGTGQATLLTGENAAERFGRHFGPWTPTSLRPLVAERSVLARARAAGRSVAFANAYPEELLDRDFGRRLPLPLRAGPVIAARGAGVLTRRTPDLVRGDAVASEITNGGWRDRLGRTEVPPIGAAEAGANLAAIVNAHDLTLYAHWATDTVGHDRDMAKAILALERVDAFLGGVVGGLGEETLVVIASDHGNIEDVRTQHTTNPALCLVWGAGHQELAASMSSLTDVAGAIERRLGT